MAKGKREIQEVNAGSMADIAFLLLVFFLVTTTMNQNQGVKATFPPYVDPDDIPEIDYTQRNILEILVNKNDQLLVEGDELKITQLRETAIEFLKADGKGGPDLPESSDKAVISLKSDRGTSYETYLMVQNELSAAYRTVRDEYSMSLYNESYTAIYDRYYDPNTTSKKDKEKLKKIKGKFPKKLSETEPEDFGGK